jgi:MoxR-like ATPase
VPGSQALAAPLEQPDASGPQGAFAIHEDGAHADSGKSRLLVDQPPVIPVATRDPASYRLNLEGLIRYGASPRATIALTLAARARAFIAGRGYVTPHDVKTVGPDVLRHRIIVSYEAEAGEKTSEEIIDQIFAGLPVP